MTSRAATGKHATPSARTDDEIWQLYVKGVQRDSRLKPVTPTPTSQGKTCRRTGLIATDAIFHLPPQETSRPFPANKAIASKKTQRDWRSGRVVVEAVLDLHGQTRAKAYASLCRFVEEAVARKHKTILVITGKGLSTSPKSSGESPTDSLRGKSVLREALPVWCAEPPLRSVIRHLSPAAPHHGGAGAFYVFLNG